MEPTTVARQKRKHMKWLITKLYELTERTRIEMESNNNENQKQQKNKQKIINLPVLHDEKGAERHAIDGHVQPTAIIADGDGEAAIVGPD